MTNTLAYHVGSNTPGYLPESDVTCWDTIAEAREALLAAMFAHVDHLDDMCDCADHLGCEECDDVHTYRVAKSTTDGAAQNRATDWHEGITFYLPTGRALPLAFWIAPVDLDHAAECEPLNG